LVLPAPSLGLYIILPAHTILSWILSIRCL